MTSIEILAQTAIKNLCSAAQREAVEACAKLYGFDSREACEKLGLEEQGNDMIADLLNRQAPKVSSGISSPPAAPIQRKHASRLSADEKAEASRMKKEQKAAEKAAKNAVKTADKMEKSAMKALAKAMKLAEKVEKTTKKKTKRAPSAYLLFSNATRSAVKDANPDMVAKEVMKELARQWKELSEEAKAPWQEKALQAKEALEAEQTEQVEEKVEEKVEEQVAEQPEVPMATPVNLDEMTVEEYLEENVRDELEVKKKVVGGVEYLVAPSTNEVFDIESQEAIGMYNAEKDEIVRTD